MNNENDTRLEPERTRAREAALQFLYAADLRKEADLDPEAYLQNSELSGEKKDFARELIKRVLDHQEELDGDLEQYADHWTVDRMSILDRNLLRLGLAELRYREESPRTVVINECVRLAKRMGSKDSKDFVNAILDREPEPETS